jgi:hypothetical protein
MENNASKVELRRISLELLVTSIFFCWASWVALYTIDSDRRQPCGFIV